MPKFILGSLREQLRRGGRIDYLSLTVAAWCRYLNGRDEQGCLLTIDDPLAERLTQQTRLGGLDPKPLLRMTEIFGEDLGHSPRFVAAVTNALRKLYELGSRATLVLVHHSIHENPSARSAHASAR